jgi:hypothetical protein
MASATRWAGLGVDSDVAVEQHAADDVAGVQGRVLRAVGPCQRFLLGVGYW